MAESPNVRLKLASRPENVLLVREMLTGVAELIEVDGNALNDIQIAVAEACNNVVLHAYEGEEGPLEIEVYSVPRALEVVVRDRGVGLEPQRRATAAAGRGFGLPVIKALVHRVELNDAPEQGSEVRMEFATPSACALASSPNGREPSIVVQAEPRFATGVTLAPPHLARTVLPRVLSVLAAHAHFTTARIGDVQLLADALAAQASRSIGDGHLSIVASVEPRCLELRIGPLDAGGARRIIVGSTVRGVGSVIETLTDDHQVASAGSSEVLALRLIDRR